ncbi:hypothetical protein [Paenibacillus marinisediminis]
MIPLVTRTLISLLLLSCFSYSTIVHADNKAPTAEAVISIRISPSATFEHNMVLKNAEVLHLFKDSKEEKSEYPTALSDIYITTMQNGSTRNFRMEKSGALWNAAELTRLVLTPKAAKQLLEHVESLRKLHYGAITPWNEAKVLLPRKSKFTIVDMETGLKFRVQRRAGSKHADVQPLTKEDTKTMKQIYDDHWSWNRKAILVVTENNMKIAASMNGMPHGGDGIPDNAFSGHFCVHFQGSSTHRSIDSDLFHQLMVYTAAGKREAYLNAISPDMLSEVYIVALSQGDRDLLQTVLDGANSETLHYFLKELDSGTTFRMVRRNESYFTNIEDQLSAEAVISMFVKRKNQTVKSVAFRFELARESVFSPWKIRNVQPIKNIAVTGIGK